MTKLPSRVCRYAYIYIYDHTRMQGHYICAYIHVHMLDAYMHMCTCIHVIQHLSACTDKSNFVLMYPYAAFSHIQYIHACEYNEVHSLASVSHIHIQYTSTRVPGYFYIYPGAREFLQLPGSPGIFTSTRSPYMHMYMYTCDSIS